MKFTEKERERLEITALFAMYEEMGDSAYVAFKGMNKDALDCELDNVYFCVIPPTESSTAYMFATDNTVDTILQSFDFDGNSGDGMVYIPLAIVNDGKLTVFERQIRDRLWREVYCFMRGVKALCDTKTPTECELLDAINAEMWCKDSVNEGEMCLSGLRIGRILQDITNPKPEPPKTAG